MTGFRIHATIALLVPLMLVACAGSTGGYRPTVPPSAELAARPGRALALTVEAEPDVVVTDADRQRILALVRRYMPRDCPGGPSPVAAEAQAPFEARIRLTRYERGNAFARAMLAGLGQIHIDAELELRPHGGDRPLAR